MKFRSSPVLKYMLWALLAIVVLFLFVLPLVTSLMIQRSPVLPKGMTDYLKFIEVVQQYLLQGLTAVWVFFLGSCFASFLNVVAWRIPRGRSILGSSACPHCKARLSFRDNFPVVGWIRNGGKCRTCKTPITVRYLIVELVLGSVFLIFVLVQLLSGGSNLPLRQPDAAGGFARVLFEPKWDLIQITGFHLTLLSMIFTFALIRMERRNVPSSIFAAFGIIGVVMSLIWPAVQLVGWIIPAEMAAPFDVASPGLYLTIATGFVGGGLVGFLSGIASGNRSMNPAVSPAVEPETNDVESVDIESETLSDVVESDSPFNLAFAFALCGMFTGWQAVFSIWLIFLMLSLMVRVLSTTESTTESTTGIGRYGILRGNDLALVFVAALIHFFTWRVTAQTEFWPGPHALSWKLIPVLCCGILLAFVMSSRRIKTGK